MLSPFLLPFFILFLVISRVSMRARNKTLCNVQYQIFRKNKTKPKEFKDKSVRSSTGAMAFGFLLCL